MECPVCQAKVIPVRLELSWVCWRIGCAAAASFFEATSTVCVCVEDRITAIQRVGCSRPRICRGNRRPSDNSSRSDILSQIVTANGVAVARWLFRQKRRIWRRAEEDTDWLKREKRLGSVDSFCHLIHFQVGDPTWNSWERDKKKNFSAKKKFQSFF